MAIKKKTTNKKAAKESVGKTCCSSTRIDKCGGSGGCSYFLGFVGAAIYFISTSTGFWNGVLGFLKAIIWPVFLVHGLLKFLGL